MQYKEELSDKNDSTVNKTSLSPFQIRIKGLAVSKIIEHVGLDEEKRMDIPKDGNG